MIRSIHLVKHVVYYLVSFDTHHVMCIAFTAVFCVIWILIFCFRGSEEFVIVDGNNRSFCLCHPKFDGERLLRPAMVARTYILWNISDSILQVKILILKDDTPHVALIQLSAGVYTVSLE